MLRSIRMVPQSDDQEPELPPATPVPALAASRKDPTSQLSDEESNEESRYRERRERPRYDIREATRRLAAYREQSEQWSSLEDIQHMKEATTSQEVSEQPESWEGLSDEQREELELMEIAAYNAAEGEETNDLEERRIP
jgi:hypothetical protein